LAVSKAGSYACLSIKQYYQAHGKRNGKEVRFYRQPAVAVSQSEHIRQNQKPSRGRTGRSMSTFSGYTRLDQGKRRAPSDAGLNLLSPETSESQLAVSR